MITVITASIGLVALAITTDAYARGKFMRRSRISGDEFFMIGLTFLVLVCIIVGAPA